MRVCETAAVRHATALAFLAAAAASGIVAALPAAAAVPAKATRLTPTPALLKALRKAHPDGVGPLSGRRCFPDDGGSRKQVCQAFTVVWARWQGKEYAAAVFWRKETDFTDALIQFNRPVGGAWGYGSDGFPPSCGFPDAVYRAWGWSICDDAG